MSVMQVSGAIIPNPFRLEVGQIEGLYIKIRDARMEAQIHENQANQLAASRFPDNESYDFMVGVVEWGRGHRFLKRAKENERFVVAQKFREAYSLGTQNLFAEAVAKVQELDYLGHSFASKHVRMMFPKSAGTLDSRIRNRLGYRANTYGYRCFLNDLLEIKHIILSSELISDEIKKSIRTCDIEMIIYEALGKQ